MKIKAIKCKQAYRMEETPMLLSAHKSELTFLNGVPLMILEIKIGHLEKIQYYFTKSDIDQLRRGGRTNFVTCRISLSQGKRVADTLSISNYDNKPRVTLSFKSGKNHRQVCTDLTPDQLLAFFAMLEQQFTNTSFKEAS